eukprot:RCo017093
MEAMRRGLNIAAVVTLLMALVAPLPTSAVGCSATPAPPGYTGDCPAGVFCSPTGIRCATGYQLIPGSTYAGAVCVASTGLFQYTGCGRPCNATIAPPGFVGDCPAGMTCTANLSCAEGYEMYPGMVSPIATCSFADGTAGSSTYPGAVAGRFVYNGCGVPCEATVPTEGFSGYCPRGLTCRNITCAPGYAISEYYRFMGAVATCASGSGGPFLFFGCVRECNATAAPPEYIGNCAGGTSCANVTCAPGYELSPYYGAPSAMCSAGGAFEFRGCVRPCNASAAPPGYNGTCPRGVLCSGNLSCASGFFPLPGFSAPVASCSNGNFSFSGCGQGCPETAPPPGYAHKCPLGLHCANVSCAPGYFQSGPTAPPRAQCGMDGKPFKFTGCIRGCPATPPSKGYSGKCPAGLGCAGVTCAKGYYPKTATKPPLAKCNKDGKPFEYSGCAAGCLPTNPPQGYSAGCKGGFSCSGVGCAKGYRGKAKVTCAKKPGAHFQFSGCTR